MPLKEGLGTLILIDEVLLYAKVKVRSDPGWLDILTSFFQYLTQAAAKVDRCCIVASLLSSEPKDQADSLGKKIVSDLYDIFQRQREAAVQPVEKDDVAEVLRRRLFDPKSVNKRESWPQQVIAALKGIAALDEQTAKLGAAAEERYLKSFPFHPELTEVFYAKWAAGIERFQKTRGVLRTFALALREAQAWDQSPLVGPAVFLSPPKQDGLSESARELVSVADTIISDGQATRWTGILETELSCARQVQAESVGLKFREIEQAAMATFLHSQPTGRSAKTRDLMLLIGPCRADKIELEKGLGRWAWRSYWLDDTTSAGERGAVARRLASGQSAEPDADAGGRRSTDQRRRGQGPPDRGDPEGQDAHQWSLGTGRPGPHAAHQAQGHRGRWSVPLRRPAAQRGFRFGKAQRRGQDGSSTRRRGPTSLACSATPCFCLHRLGTGLKWHKPVCATTWHGKRSWTT